MQTKHAVILDADGVYFGEVIGDDAAIALNVPAGGSFEVLPDGTPTDVSLLLFGPLPGFNLPPAE